MPDAALSRSRRFHHVFLVESEAGQVTHSTGYYRPRSAGRVCVMSWTVCQLSALFSFSIVTRYVLFVFDFGSTAMCFCVFTRSSLLLFLCFGDTSFSADYTFAFEPIVLLLPDKLQQSHAFRWVSYRPCSPRPAAARSRLRLPAFHPPLALDRG